MKDLRILPKVQELKNPTNRSGNIFGGGAARALRKVAGRNLGRDELSDAVALCARLGPSGLTRRFGIEPARAGTLTAGAIILGELHELVGVPFVVARGGLREGLAHSLLGEQVAA